MSSYTSRTHDIIVCDNLTSHFTHHISPEHNRYVVFELCIVFMNIVFMNIVFRITLLVLVKLIFPEIPQAQAQSNYALTKQDNKVLSGNSLANFTQTTMKNCLPRCLENCLCMSFDICDENKCQLRTSNAQLKPSSLEALEDCSHYEFKQVLNIS